MSMLLEALTTLYPDQVWLEVSPDEIEKTWPLDLEYSYDVARWTAFKNRLTLDAFLGWFKAESGIEEQPMVWPSQNDLPSIWEVVNGTALQLGETRIVLIPSEEMHTNEFCVQAEWVDIPSWAADYYLAVQVNPDDGWLRVWGYTTHKKLKQAGQYNNIRRTYSLEPEQLIEDLNVMWVARELGRDRKAPIAPVPILLPRQAKNLLEQLSQPSSYSPRLKVDFAQWAAFIENETQRQQLYKRTIVVATIINHPTRQRKLSGVDLSGADLRCADLSEASLGDADLSRVNFSNANFRSTNLSDADLSDTNLSHAQLLCANLSGANLSNVNLSSANLNLANLSHTDLSKANLSNAWLRNADLSHANLSDANLSNADLSDADLSHANLRGATNLRGANLAGANVEDAQFERDTGLTKSQERDLERRGAKFGDSGAREPLGFSR